MEFYIAVLEDDCQPHYFLHPESAIKYLENNVKIEGCKVEPNSDKLENGEVWDKNGISVGYFYKVKTED